MKRVKIFAIAVIALVSSLGVKAQLSVGADIVSSYVWRGVAQGSNEPNIQPGLSYSFGGLTLGAWGSGNLSGSLKEFDLYASYAINDMFSLTLTDYNWGFTKSYFEYGSDKTDHIYEATLGYGGIESFPLTASVNVMFAGADKNNAGDQAFSSYVELGYPITSDLSVFAGAALNESPAVYGTDGFGFTNVGLKGTKEIQITDKFSLPVYSIVGVNPDAKNAFLVVGVTL
ncbi:MAG: hypothetical protein PHH37_02560 [Paludibacter sp.]|nr:hypothetical protein [Paludibacter sp.]